MTDPEGECRILKQLVVALILGQGGEVIVSRRDMDQAERRDFLIRPTCDGDRSFVRIRLYEKVKGYPGLWDLAGDPHLKEFLRQTRKQ